MTSLQLPQRTQKPRATGITSVHDVGIPLDELRAILSDYGDFIDMAKFGVGSAYITPRLREKIALYEDFRVTTYFGGTLFEKFYHQGLIKEYAQYLKDHKITWVEVSTGILDIPLPRRLEVVRQLTNEFTVIAEIGSKDAEKTMPPSQWIDEIHALLEAGCRYVITEGRDSGTAGIFKASGEMRSDLVTEILRNCDPARILFEAPTHKTQMFFINAVGANVNLGNINPRDLLLLEAQRQALRNETFHLRELHADRPD